MAIETFETAPPPYDDPGALISPKETVRTEGQSKPSFFYRFNHLEQDASTNSTDHSCEYKAILVRSWINVGEDGKTWHEVFLPHNCPDHLLDKVISVHFYLGQEGMKSTWCTHCKAPVDVDIQSLQKEILLPESISEDGLRFVFPGKHLKIEKPLKQPEPWLGRIYNILTKECPEKIPS